jgi:drug/metabolite transporter (DMT)-like permease
MSQAKPLTGVILMVAGMAVLPFMDVIAKWLGSAGMPVLQIVWARMAFGALMTLPFAIAHAGPRAAMPQRPGLHALRAILLMGSTFFFFSALQTLPIADALAIFFVNPLIITALSPLILGERVGPRRWAAVGVGFIGTLIIIRPGLEEITSGTIMAFAAGCSLALYFLMTRRIAGASPAMVTTYDTSLMGTLILSVAMWFMWKEPSPQEWLLFAALGLIATLGHWLIVRAYDHAEASLLAPFAYTEMIGAVVLGWIFFRDFPDRWTFAGVGVLIASALYISARERLHSKALAQP